MNGAPLVPAIQLVEMDITQRPETALVGHVKEIYLILKNVQLKIFVWVNLLKI